MYMNKRTAKESLRRQGSELLSIKEFAEYAGIHRNTAARILEDVPYICIGKSKKYAVDDIAELLTGRRTV